MLRTGTFVTVVSGLPRSGTSMAMRMLAAGGLDTVVDHERSPDSDNPHGYFEFEPVKQLRDDSSWVAEARGQAVKIIYKLIYDLPMNLEYRIIFMQRDLVEVLRSQETMLKRMGKVFDPAARDELLYLFQSEVFAFQRWAQAQRNIEILYLTYSDVVDRPREAARRMAAFLDLDLNLPAMVRAVDSQLYRSHA